jgi:glucan phosphoethanolaminetransferase (alkaline phosphatase superfamily)
VLGDSLTTSEHGDIVFVVSMLLAYFVSDLVKIVIAKRLKAKLTPRLIFKTKKIIAIVILGFGVLLFIQGIFPDTYEKNREKLEKISPIKEK